MTSLTSTNIRMAIESLRSSKMRSLLTMLGIIIGVVSVVTAVSLGQGVKQELAGQISQSGKDLVTIRPGRIIKRDARGKISGYNYLAALGTSSLSDQDYHAIKKSSGVRTAVPFTVINGTAQTDEGVKLDTTTIIGTTDGLPEVLNQKIEFGEFFGPGEANRNVAVIGKRVAEQLFKENVPTGRLFSLRGHEFTVRGVFDEFPPNALSTSPDFNAAIFIPYNVARSISGGSAQTYQILAKPAKGSKLPAVINDINANLLKNHDGQADFTVLSPSDNLAVTSSLLNVITGFVAGIAAISLIVGGVGIMNIMLVSVTERTREIGIRKSIGATNRQIMGQFLIEAIVLSFVGGIIGLLLSLATNFLLRIFTDLRPVITLPVMILTTVVSIAVGIIFGITPAVKAARKDPIIALRYE
jgi:ABC-type antimicrobial peptide transport system permease subunit